MVWRNNRRWPGYIQLRKTLYKFYRQKNYAVALNHIYYNEVYNHHLFPILINFTRKFYYWHRQELPTTFLRKTHFERFRKIPRSHTQRSATFIKLYVGRQQGSKIVLHRKCFLQVYEKFPISTSDHLWGLRSKSNHLV